MAAGKRTAADLGAHICFEDEAGQGLRPPKGHTWAPRVARPVVRVRGRNRGRVNIAGVVCYRLSTYPKGDAEMADPRGISLWNSLTIERRFIPDQGRVTYQPRQDWFTIVALLRGLCQFEYPDGSGWHQTTLVCGDTSRLVGKSAVRLWRPQSGKQRVEVAFIALPTQLFRYYADEHPEVTVRDLSALETPRVFDPVAAAMAPGLLRAHDAGVGEHYAYRAAHYLTAHILHPLHDLQSDTPGLNPERLLTVTNYMHEHLASHITLEDMAKEALLSRYHFVRQFAAATGKTPVQYLTELRVDTACRLLTTSNELISQVGSRCGFPNPENFARVFKKHLGCSPLQYRQRSLPA